MISSKTLLVMLAAVLISLSSTGCGILHRGFQPSTTTMGIYARCELYGNFMNEGNPVYADCFIGTPPFRDSGGTGNSSLSVRDAFDLLDRLAESSGG